MNWLSGILSGIYLICQVGVAVMGRPTAISKKSQTCDLSFYEWNRSTGRQWSATIRIAPPKDMIIRNAVGLQYRFEGKLIRRGQGHADILGEWNTGKKDIAHPSPIEINKEPIEASWISKNASDWLVEVWVTIGTRRKRTLYKGLPTGAIDIAKDS